jgi:DNA-binding CsgD family transcriptional regulator
MTQPVKEGRHINAGPRRSTRRLPWMLTPTEWRVVQAVCSGSLTRIELAQQFGVDKRTIDTHLGHIFRKMSVPSTTGVVLCVLRHDAARRACWPELKIEEVGE